MNPPTFIIADESGQTQLGLVKGEMAEAQQQAAETARLLGATVLLYSVTHVATYGPSSAGGNPADKVEDLR